VYGLLPPSENSIAVNDDDDDDDDEHDNNNNNNNNNICGFSKRKVLQLSLLAPRVLRRLLHFKKICTPLV
jgi:hypothetical protein